MILTYQEIINTREKLVRSYLFSIIYGIIIWFQGINLSDGILKNIVWLFMSIGFTCMLTTIIFLIYLSCLWVKQCKHDKYLD